MKFEVDINIPRNDYKENMNIRNEVVQGICDAFLSGCGWRVFHPRSDGRYRYKTNIIIRHKGINKKFYGFWSGEPCTCDEGIKFTANEMKAAIKVLQSHGYFIHKKYEYGTWLGYTCEKYPTMEDSARVENIELTADFDR